MPYIGNAAGNRFVASKAASVYSGNGSTTAFTLEHAVGSDEDILVSVDGVIQEPSVAYAVSSGTTLTFTAAPSSNSGNNIFVYYLFRTVGTVDHPSTSSLQATDGTFSSTLDVTGALSAKGGAVFNEDSADVDFRVESNGNTHMLFVEGGTDKVGISTSSPASLLTIGGNVITTLKPTVAISDTTSGGTMALRGQSPKLAFDVTSSGVPKILMDNAGAEFKSGTLDAEGDVHLKIDANGHITKPLQPAFQVQPSSNQLNVGDNGTIAFGTERFDQNGDFASNTFTAPVTGKYQFNVVMRVDNIDRDANWVRVELQTSNFDYLSSIFDPGVLSSDPVYWSISFSILVDMDANDTANLVWGQGGGSNTADIDTQCQFSGYLVA